MQEPPYICPHCGARTHQQDQFCPNCGGQIIKEIKIPGKGIGLSPDEMEKHVRELNDYIKKCRDKGVPFELIKTQLLGAGWPEDFIAPLVSPSERFQTEEDSDKIAEGVARGLLEANRIQAIAEMEAEIEAAAEEEKGKAKAVRTGGTIGFILGLVVGIGFVVLFWDAVEDKTSLIWVPMGISFVMGVGFAIGRGASYELYGS